MNVFLIRSSKVSTRPTKSVYLDNMTSWTFWSHATSLTMVCSRIIWASTTVIIYSYYLMECAFSFNALWLIFRNFESRRARSTFSAWKNLLTWTIWFLTFFLILCWWKWTKWTWATSSIFQNFMSIFSIFPNKIINVNSFTLTIFFVIN